MKLSSQRPEERACAGPGCGLTFKPRRRNHAYCSYRCADQARKAGTVKRRKRNRKTHCPKGHKFNKKNSCINSRGYVECRKCHNIRSSAAYKADPKKFLERGKAWRAANRDKCNETQRNYRKAHLHDKRKYMRDRRQDLIPKVHRDDLKAFRKDPEREKLLGIADYVICRECGGKLGGSLQVHVIHVHKKTVKAYLRKWHYPALWSASCLVRQSRAAKDRIARGRGVAFAPTNGAKWLTGKKPGRRPDDQTGARLDELAKSRLRWDAIKELVDKETGVHRTVDAYQELLKRWRRRQKPTN